MTKIAKALQSSRKACSLTQEDLAQKADISYSTLAKIERGAIKDPSFSTVVALTSALNISLDDLLKQTSDDAPANSEKIKFVYCDVNGVLVRFFQRAFVSMAEKTHQDASAVEAAFWHYNAAVNKGEMTTQQFNDAVARRLRVDSIDWEKAYMEGVEAVPAMHKCLEEAAKTTKVGLLTNIFPGFVEAMIKNGLLPDIPYTTIVDSSVVGAIKPESEIYKVAEKQAGYSGSEILFIDDSRTNLMEAETHDWRVLWFDDYRPEESVRRVQSALKNN